MIHLINKTGKLISPTGHLAQWPNNQKVTSEKVYKPVTNQTRLRKEVGDTRTLEADLPQLRGDLGFDPVDHFFPKHRGGGAVGRWVHLRGHAAI